MITERRGSICLSYNTIHLSQLTDSCQLVQLQCILCVEIVTKLLIYLCLRHVFAPSTIVVYIAGDSNNTISFDTSLSMNSRIKTCIPLCRPINNVRTLVKRTDAILIASRYCAYVFIATKFFKCEMVKNTVQSLKAENDKQKEKVEEDFAERS